MGFGNRDLDYHGKAITVRSQSNDPNMAIIDMGRNTGVRSVTVYGGVSAFHQISALRQRPEIVVGCPGRVLDLAGGVDVAV